MAHSVDILIKARDEASKQFGIIGASAAVMGKALKGSASIISSAFSEAFRIAKYSVLSLGAAFTYCTYEAMKQQAAEIELASALKATGQYSEETMKKLKAQAVAIQDVTIYGDEYIETLMQMAIAQGVSADKAGEAAKGAIALYEGFGGGKGSPETFLGAYLRALQGVDNELVEIEGPLKKYVLQLRLAKTEEEKQKILQDALAQGWEIAKSKAESASGALKQMKNRLGEIAEAIGMPFLPAITSAAQAITKWAKENEDSVAYWANKTYSYVTLIKDVFLDFVGFMRNDWRAGLGFVFDSFLKLLRATFEAAVTLAIAGGKGIRKGIREGLLGEPSTNQKAIEDLIEQKYIGLSPKELQKYSPAEILEGLGFGPEHRSHIYEDLRKEAEAEFQKRKARTILGDTISAVTDSFKEAFEGILKDMPADLRAKVDAEWKRHLDRLKELGAAPGPKPAGGPGKEGAPAPFSWGDLLGGIGEKIKQATLPWKEQRFLTFAPGTKFNQTEKNTGETAKSTSRMTKLIENTNKKLDEVAKAVGKSGVTLTVSNL